jgi:hypothetical protein
MVATAFAKSRATSTEPCACPDHALGAETRKSLRSE